LLIVHLPLADPSFRLGLLIHIPERRTGPEGIVDTGADECAVPAFVANILGHNLQAGRLKQIRTGNGVTNAYSHLTRFEIFHPATKNLLYTTHDTPIDFLPNLHVILLGVNSFLSQFILTIDYPKKVFSIRKSI
jgi:hypothetical protein